MSEFTINVKGILETTDIQAQLNKFSQSVKPVKIDVSATSNVSDLGKNVTQVMDASGNLQKQIEKTQTGLYSYSQATYEASEGTGELALSQTKVVNNGIAYEKQITKNAQALSTLQLRVNGLTDAQRKEIETQLGGVTVQDKLNQISALGTTNIAEQTSAISGLRGQISAVSYGLTNFSMQMDAMIQRFIQIGIYVAVFRKLKQAISSMIDTVSSLDASIVELKKVTDLTGNSLEKFVTQAYDVGQEVARTGQEVIDAAAIFSRSGYDIQEALDLSEVSMVMLNVGDGIDNVSDAATSLISILKGFNMEASQSGEILDLINEISNTSAINFEDLMEGLTRTSATFNQAGVSIEKTSALLTGANEVLQNIEFEIRYLNHSAYVQKCA